MINNSSKQRLRMAHQFLDKEISNNSFSRNSVTKQTEGSRTKNVQSEINDLQRKLMELQKKMGNIDVSSSNQDQENNIMSVIARRSNRAESNQNKNNQKQKIRTLSKKSLTKLPNNYAMKNPLSSSASQDSEDDDKIYAKIQSEKQKNKNKPSINEKIKKIEEKPKIQFQSVPKTSQLNQGILKNSSRKPYKIQNPIMISKKKDRNPLKNSIKSIDSKKSKKSIHSNYSNSSLKKIQRSSSKKSIGSIGEGGLSMGDLRQLQVQNAKQMKRISNLEKQLNHYKRLCQKQQQKIQQFRIMQIEYRKLQTNFAKSEQIRKQQKKIIQNLKTKN